MRVTKEYLKQIIKEEVEKLDELELPMQKDLPYSKPGASGPEAQGDVVSNALYTSARFIEVLLEDEHFKKINDQYSVERLTEILGMLKEAHNALMSIKYPGAKSVQMKEQSEAVQKDAMKRAAAKGYGKKR